MGKHKLTLRLRLTLLMSAILIAACGVFLLSSILSARDTYRFPGDEVPAQVQGTPPEIPPSLEEKMLVVKKEQDEIFASRNAVIFAFIILLSAGATYLTAGKALEPITRLCAEVGSIDESKLSHRVAAPRSNDEVSALAAAFNKMLGRIEKAFASQKDFSAKAAHELRTPLAGIISSVEVLLLDELPDPRECKETLNDVLQSAIRLNTLVDGLLQLDRELRTTDCESFSAGETVASIENELSRKLLEKGVALDNRCGEVQIYGEKNLLYRALFNLIHNAVRYNRQNGAVSVTAREEGGFTAIAVRDTGVGIPESELERVFEPLYCVDKSWSRELGGSGLGLSIVKAVVEKHGGGVSLESRLGEWTEFTVRLPKRI